MFFSYPHFSCSIFPDSFHIPQVLSFCENAACATKCADEIVGGIVLKVLNARPKSKQLGIDICMMLIELEKQDVVMEELSKGFTNKQPKIVAATVQTCTKALGEFGGECFTC